MHQKAPARAEGTASLENRVRPHSPSGDDAISPSLPAEHRRDCPGKTKPSRGREAPWSFPGKCLGETQIIMGIKLMTCLIESALLQERQACAHTPCHHASSVPVR